MKVSALVYIILAIVFGVLFQLEVSEDPLITEKTVTVYGNRREAFKYAANPANFPLWYPGVLNEEPLDKSALGVGKRFVEQFSFPLFGEFTFDVEVTKYVLDSQTAFIEYESDFELVKPRYQLHCEDSAPSKFNGKPQSKITWRMYSKRRSYLFYATAVQIGDFIFLRDRLRMGLLNLSNQLLNIASSKIVS